MLRVGIAAAVMITVGPQQTNPWLLQLFVKLPFALGIDLFQAIMPAPLFASGQVCGLLPLSLQIHMQHSRMQAQGKACIVEASICIKSFSAREVYDGAVLSEASFSLHDRI